MRRNINKRSGEQPKNFYLRCEVSLGSFKRERGVMIEIPDFGKIAAIVDQDDVLPDSELKPGSMVPGRVKILVIKKKQNKFIVDLPRETFTSGRRISVPQELVVSA